MLNDPHIGDTVEIRKAFSESGYRDMTDDIAGCEAEVLEFRGADAFVFVKAKGEYWVPRSRLGLVRRI